MYTGCIILGGKNGEREDKRTKGTQEGKREARKVDLL